MRATRHRASRMSRIVAEKRTQTPRAGVLVLLVQAIAGASEPRTTPSSYTVMRARTRAVGDKSRRFTDKRRHFPLAKQQQQQQQQQEKQQREQHDQLSPRRDGGQKKRKGGTIAPATKCAGFDTYADGQTTADVRNRYTKRCRNVGPLP